MVGVHRFATPAELHHLLEEVLGVDAAERLQALEKAGVVLTLGMDPPAEMDNPASESREYWRLDGAAKEAVCPLLTTGALVILGFPEDDPGRAEPVRIAPPFLREADFDWADDRVTVSTGRGQRSYIGCTVKLPPSSGREGAPQAPHVSQREAPAPDLPPPSLRAPDKVDVWAEVILVAEEEHRREHGTAPRQHQLWLRLKTNPPPGYDIEWDPREDALRMEREPLLNRSAFNKRHTRMLREPPP
jgi:hypothetical protein